MKRLLAAGFGLLAIASVAGTANAADLQRRYEAARPAPPPVVQIYNWTGPYLGIAGGYGWGRGTVSGLDINTDGALVGGTVGYNWQAGAAVFGVEGDLSWADISGRRSGGVCVNCDVRNTWLSTVRGRVGFAADRFMPYVTGGLAFGEVDTNGGVGFPGKSSTRTGWTLGGGVEAAVAANWTVKAEYLYVDLGKFNCGANCPGAGANPVHFRSNIVRAGLNYRF